MIRDALPKLLIDEDGHIVLSEHDIQRIVEAIIVRLHLSIIPEKQAAAILGASTYASANLPERGGIA